MKQDWTRKLARPVKVRRGPTFKTLRDVGSLEEKQDLARKAVPRDELKSFIARNPLKRSRGTCGLEGDIRTARPAQHRIDL